MPARAGRGHGTRPHTADLVIEAWGESREACLEEGVRALVDAYAGTAGARPTGEIAVEVPPAADEELLVQVLEEVILLGDVQDLVPVDVTVTRRDGGLLVVFATVPVGAIEPLGAAPKAVARTDLAFDRGPAGWRCRATIDV